MDSSVQKLRFRFGVRSILLVVLIVSLFFAIALPTIRRGRAVAILRDREFYIHFRPQDQLTFRERVSISLFGMEAACPVDSLDVIELWSQQEVEAIAALTELKHLNIVYNSNPLDFSPLRSLVNLESLTGEDGWVGDTSFIPGCFAAVFIAANKDITKPGVQNPQKLKKIGLSRTEFSNDLAVIGELSKIESVRISLADLKMTNESLAKLCNATTLRELDLDFNLRLGSVTDFKPLTKLTKLGGLLDPSREHHQEIIALLPKNCEVTFLYD